MICIQLHPNFNLDGSAAHPGREEREAVQCHQGQPAVPWCTNNGGAKELWVVKVLTYPEAGRRIHP